MSMFVMFFIYLLVIHTVSCRTIFISLSLGHKANMNISIYSQK